MPSPIPKPVSQVAAALAVIVSALGVYWSLRADSTLPFPQLFPAWLPAWAEQHGTFRNYPAYLILSTLWFVAGRNWRQRLFAGVALGAFASVAEVVQYWLAHRYASVADAAWSWAGIATAWGLCRLVHRALRRWREKRLARPDLATGITTHAIPAPVVVRATEQRADSELNEAGHD